MGGISYDNGFIILDVEKLEVEECIAFLEKHYKLLEQGRIPLEIVKKVVDSYKSIRHELNIIGSE